jgi:hypothetical protein
MVSARGRRKLLDDLFRRRRARAEPRLDRQHIETPAKAHQLLAPLKPTQSLVDGLAGTEMQEFLGADQSAFRQWLGMAQNEFGNGLHSLHLLSEMQYDFW